MALWRYVAASTALRLNCGDARHDLTLVGLQRATQLSSSCAERALCSTHRALAKSSGSASSHAVRPLPASVAVAVKSNQQTLLTMGDGRQELHVRRGVDRDGRLKPTANSDHRAKYERVSSGSVLSMRNNRNDVLVTRVRTKYESTPISVVCGEQYGSSSPRSIAATGFKRHCGALRS
jgi:aconitase A